MNIGDVLDALDDKTDKSLVKRLSQTIENVSRVGWSLPRDSFSPSTLFYCERGAFCRRAGCPENPSALSVMRMKTGIAIHEIIQECMKGRMGFSQAETYVGSKDPPVLGRIDGVIKSKGLLVEIKTAGGYTAKSLTEGKVPDYYMDQAHLYVSLWNAEYTHTKHKLSDIWFLCLERDSMRWIDVPVVEYDVERAERIRQHVVGLQELWETDKLPDPNSKCQSDCEYFTTCRRADRLSDLLPGGRIREEARG